MSFTDNYSAGGANGARDRITQALMQVQNPPPVADAPPMPAPAMMQAGAANPAASGAAPPAATGTPGMNPMASTPPMLPQLGAAALPGTQPGGMLAQPTAAAGMPPRPY